MACSIMGLLLPLKPSISYPKLNAAADVHPGLHLEQRRAILARTQSPRAPGVSEPEDDDELARRIAGILPNAKLRQQIETDRMRRSVGIDFGLQRTGVAVTLCGLAPRPLSVVDLRGDKLVEKLLSVAEEHKADEFIVGLPRSWNYIEENEQCHKTRTFAGRLAQWSAEKGIRVFLHDEYMSTSDALEFMTFRGSTKKTKRLQVDAYAAMVILQTYFHYEGRMAELVIPRRGVLQQKLCEKYYERLTRVNQEDYHTDDDEEEELILI